jgi:hypothetical protein
VRASIGWERLAFMFLSSCIARNRGEVESTARLRKSSVMWAAIILADAAAPGA